MTANKIKTFDAVLPLIENGQSIALGGMTLYRRPVAFVLHLIRAFHKNQSPKDLNLIVFTGGYESDLLIGAGMVSSVQTCYFGLEIFGFAPMFTYYANQGKIKIIEETEASLAFGLRAQMAGVGFMPGNAWIGTDLPKLRPEVKIIQDPYSEEQYMAFPAIKPDVAIIHALKADQDGNAQIGQNKGVDEELSITSDLVLVTAEEIVPALDKADLVAPFVDAVIHAPRGASPTSCHPIYKLNGQAILSYVEQVSDEKSFHNYLSTILS